MVKKLIKHLIVGILSVILFVILASIFLLFILPLVTFGQVNLLSNIKDFFSALPFLGLIVIPPLAIGITIGSFYLEKGKKLPLFILPLAIGGIFLIFFTAHCFLTAKELGLLGCFVLPPILFGTMFVPYTIISFIVDYLYQKFSFKKILRITIMIISVILILGSINYLFIQYLKNLATSEKLAIETKQPEFCKKLERSLIPHADMIAAKCITDVAKKAKDESICLNYLSGKNDDKDLCIFDVAKAKQNIEICKNITGIFGGRPFRDSCVAVIALNKLDVLSCEQANTERESCIQDIAFKTADPVLCQRLNVNKENCIESILESAIDRTTLDEFRKKLLEKNQIDLRLYASDQSIKDLSDKRIDIPIIVPDFDVASAHLSEGNMRVLAQNSHVGFQTFFIFIIENKQWKLNISESAKINYQYPEAMNTWKNYGKLFDYLNESSKTIQASSPTPSLVL